MSVRFTHTEISITRSTVTQFNSGACRPGNRNNCGTKFLCLVRSQPWKLPPMWPWEPSGETQVPGLLLGPPHCGLRWPLGAHFSSSSAPSTHGRPLDRAHPLLWSGAGPTVTVLLGRQGSGFLFFCIKTGQHYPVSNEWFSDVFELPLSHTQFSNILQSMHFVFYF